MALLELFGGELEKIRLQKLLFLFCQKQEKPEYEFVPYKYGCFSYSATADLSAMARKGLLSETDTIFAKTASTNYFMSLKPDDQLALRKIKAAYGSMSGNALMKHTYQKYPYWAINSVKAKSILNDGEYALVEAARPHGQSIILFTIGYEGNSLENYLNRLLKNDVKALIDVRNNPLSMKFGFGKTLLKRYCEYLGIAYFHFPDVGITSEYRQELKTQADYDRLFEIYRKTNIPKTVKTQSNILDLLKKYERVALTCFEAQPCQCHRSHLADAIKALPGFDYEIRHI